MVKIIAANSEICCVSVVAPSAPDRLVLRRRLKYGASRRALLAVQAAMSAGIILSSPAHAQTTLSDSTSTVYLSASGGVGGNPFSVSSGTSITAPGVGVQGGPGRYTLSNAGYISSAGVSAIQLNGGGTVSNTGTIAGAAADAYGVDLFTGIGSVSNSGTIIGHSGVALGGGGNIGNSGSIGGSAYGVLMIAGPSGVQNSGTITGGTGGAYSSAIFMTNGYVSNSSAGLISAGTGVLSLGGSNATLVNNGTILGTGGAGTAGAAFGEGTVFNSGLISGAGSQGLIMSGGGYVNNTGSILGGDVGVSISGGPGTIINNGATTANYISGSSDGVILAGAGSTLITRGIITTSPSGNAGVIMNGGYLDNQAAGTFANAGSIYGGENGVIGLSNYDIHIVNNGTILGRSNDGISLTGGGTVTNGGVVAGGYSGIFDVNDAVSIINSGVILGSTGQGLNLQDGGSVYNSAVGTIAGEQLGIVINGASGAVENHGLIEGGGYAGVGIYDNGSVANLGGTITGALGVQFAYLGATRTSTGSIYNTGLITGTTYNGVGMYTGGQVTNAATGTIQALSSAANGVYIGGGVGSVANEGVILGGASGAGVSLAGGGYVFNSGSISGGVGVKMAGVNPGLYNVGQIHGAATGVELVNGGYVDNNWRYGCAVEIGSIYGSVTGVQVDAGFGSVVNYGFIGGGSNGDTGTGVALNGGGSVKNLDFVYGASLYAGVIQGGSVGVAILNASGYVGNDGVINGSFAGVALLDGGVVNNQDFHTTIGGNPVSLTGTIAGTRYGVFVGTLAAGTVFNSGFIAGDDAGVYLGDGGSVTNRAGGDIFALGYGVQITGAAGYLANAGAIRGVEYLGADLTRGGTVINAAGAYIKGDDVGVFIGTSPSFGQQSAGTVLNAGLIYASQSTGIVMLSGGYVSNASTGTISGNQTGIYLYAQPSVASSIFNAGTISGGGSFGVQIEGNGLFDLTNAATGSITGKTGAYIHTSTLGTAFVTNSGLIVGTAGPGLDLEGPGALNAVNNAGGTILGSNEGISVELGGQASITNAGLVYGVDYGIYAYAPAVSITNLQSGTISAYYEAIQIDAAESAIDNKGVIEAAEEDYGIETYGTLSTVLNEAGAVISGGEEGVYSTAANFTLDNLGTITGAYEEGVLAEGSLTAVLVNYAGGTITGPDEAVWLESAYGSLQNSGVLEGEYAAVMENSLGSLLNTDTGTITGSREGVFSEYGEEVSNAGYIIGNTFAGVELYNGGELVNSGVVSGGQIGVSDYGGYSGQTVSNFADIFNGGIISGSETGIKIGEASDLQIANARGGIITGGTYGVAVGYQGQTTASFGTIFNSGSITGGATGALLNYGGIVSNDAGGVISGGSIGIQAGYTGNTLANTAVIANGGLISGGVTGVDLAAGGSVVNTGTITGGMDGIDFAPGAPASVTNSGRITGVSGVGVQLGGGSLNNEAHGLIEGGTDGVIAQNGASIINAGRILDNAGPAHAGVVLYGQTSLTNLATGTISGSTGVLVSGDAATIVDEGAIISTDGGDAIQILPSADPAQITLTTGSKLTGAIDGGGTGGSITLTGQNTLDDTIANFGTGSSLTIAKGANWTGVGNWTIANVDNTGTFQAGVLNAPLDLTGNFASTGTLVVVVTPTISNQLHVTGTADFSGGLTYVFAPGTYTPGYKYDFVTATGGAKGDFTTVTYVGATPAYVSKTTNVLISGKSLGSNLVLGGRIAPLDASIFADSNQDQAVNAQADNDFLLGQASAGDEAQNAAACAAAARVMPDQTDVHGMSTAARMTSAVASALCGAGGWIEADGSTSSIDNSGQVPGYNANDAGFLAGLDRPVGSFGTKLGLALGYDDAWLDDKAGGKATADTIRVGLYAAQPIGRFTIAADIMYGSASDTSTRPTGIAAATGSYKGNEFNGGVQISTGLDLRGIAVTPAAGIKFAAISTGGFTETAPTGLSPFAVAPQTSSYASVQPYLDIGMSKSFTTESLVTITPSVSLGYQLETGERGKSVNIKTQDATLFTSGHTTLDTGGAKIGASIAAGKNNWSLYAKYAATISGNWAAQLAEAGLQIEF